MHDSHDAGAPFGPLVAVTAIIGGFMHHFVAVLAVDPGVIFERLAQVGSFLSGVAAFMLVGYKVASTCLRWVGNRHAKASK